MNLSMNLFAGGAWLDEAMFTNLGTVAFGLMIVCSVLGIVYFIGHFSAGKAKNAEPAVQNMTPSAEPKTGASAPASDDGALIAVLTAAVAAVLAEEASAAGTVPPSFRVVSFQRSSRGRSWNGHC